MAMVTSIRGYKVGVSTVLCFVALFLIFAAYVDMLTYIVTDPTRSRALAMAHRRNRSLDPGTYATRGTGRPLAGYDPVNDVIMRQGSQHSQPYVPENKAAGYDKGKSDKKQLYDKSVKKLLKSLSKKIKSQEAVGAKKPGEPSRDTGKSTEPKKESKEEDPSYIIHRKFTESQDRSIFILGAVGKNSTAAARWDKFAVYGQWYNHDDLKIWSLRCCFKYADGTLIERKIASFFAKKYFPPGGQNVNRGKLRLWHTTCDNPGKGPFLTPHWISIARNRSCSSPDVNYIQPYLNYKRAPGHLTITTKMAYAKIKPETVISYLESARVLGIDKVLTYVLDNLDPTVERILRHYASTGILDYYKLELADLQRLPRSYPPLGPQYMNDEWLVMRDSIERNMGSDYFGIFDMDEYLVPSGNRTIKQMLSSLRTTYPNASHFFFTNIHYLSEYELQIPDCYPNCSQFRRHVKTAPSKFDYNSIHEKMILLTSRVQTSSIRNHYVTSLSGYSLKQCPPAEGYVRHYGSCLRKFTEKVCTHPRKWVLDESMVKWAAESSIEKNVLASMKRFLT